MRTAAHEDAGRDALCAPPTPAAPTCANCHAELAGEYCCACGQRAEPHTHSIWGFVREAAESLTHADSRLWRTLRALLFAPGRLTREFLAGRRASQLPPFRLYLVVSVLFFALASLLGKDDYVVVGEVGEARAERAKLQQEAAQAGSPVARGATGLAGASVAPPPPETCDLRYSGPWQDFLAPRLSAACRKVFADRGRALGQAFTANVPTMLFLFLPLIALVLKVLYLPSRRYYVEHLLFCVHNHSFAFVLFALLMLATAPLPESLAGLVIVAAFGYCAWYFFRAMRVVYGQSRVRTAAKFTVLGVTYGVSGVMLTVLTLIYSVLAL